MTVINFASTDRVMQVLLELTDTELEAGLGLTHAMHRKKIRLAIEERRNPSAVRYPLLSSLGNMWVTSEWLADIGLTQVSCWALNKRKPKSRRRSRLMELDIYLLLRSVLHQNVFRLLSKNSTPTVSPRV